MNRLHQFLCSAKQFRVHTGNITVGPEFKQREFANPSAELADCLRVQLLNWHPEEERELSESTFECIKGDCSVLPIAAHARAELEITAKVFLSAPDAAVVKECVMFTLDQCQTTFVERLIIALPPPDDSLGESTVAEQVLSMWNDLEELVEAGYVKKLGIADLTLDDLQSLYLKLEGRIKPTIVHYSIASCCSVPKDLLHFTDSHGIALITHNDPHPFLTTKQVQTLFADCLDVPRNVARRWRAIFACRYTVMLKYRSVIAAKGYLVHFQNCGNCSLT